MKISMTLLFAAALGLVTGCAGTGAPGSAMQADQVAASSTEKVRCKTIIKTGTRLGTKVCKSEAQWEQDARDSREATENIQRTSTHGPGPEGG